jgi:hypothetical protein
MEYARYKEIPSVGTDVLDYDISFISIRSDHVGDIRVDGS